MRHAPSFFMPYPAMLYSDKTLGLRAVMHRVSYSPLNTHELKKGSHTTGSFLFQ